MTLLLIGTFLPWLQSGRVTRNSYQLAGIGRRTLDAPAWVEFLLGGWPLLGPLWAVVFVVLVLKLHRIAAWSSVVLALPAVLIAGAALVAGSKPSSAYLAVVWTGPLVTAAGGIAVFGAAVGLIVSRSSRRRSFSGPVEPIGPAGASR